MLGSGVLGQAVQLHVVVGARAEAGKAHFHHHHVKRIVHILCRDKLDKAQNGGEMSIRGGIKKNSFFSSEKL